MKATDVTAPRKWAWHQRTLVRLRDALQAESNERNLASRASLERGGADLVDVANDEREHEGLLVQLTQEQTELAEIEAALERIRDGTYGRCEATGELIAPERLRALPWTRFSQAAAAQREKIARPA